MRPLRGNETGDRLPFWIPEILGIFALRELKRAGSGIARKICGVGSGPSEWDVRIAAATKDAISLFGQDFYHLRLSNIETQDALIRDMLNREDALSTEFLSKLETFEAWSGRPECRDEAEFEAFREYVSGKLTVAREFFSLPPSESKRILESGKGRVSGILNDSP